jgi:peptide/nickel transport system substrate-binding protein
MMAKQEIDRRDFLKIMGAGTAATMLVACGTQAPAEEVEEPAEAETEAPEEAASTEPKILRMRIYGDIQNLDPAHRISENDDIILEAVTDGLVRYAPNSYDVINQLAESIEQSDDGLTVTFKLKEGVQWHNGYGEVTTEDVKFSFERFLDPELDAAYADDWATLDNVEIIDDYNGVIHFTEPFAPLWHTTLPIASGVIICKKYVEEVGIEAFATNIMGCGPYMFEEWQPEQMVILKRNPDYYGEQPYYDEIHLLPISEDSAAEVALEAGELDFGLISIPGIERFASNADYETDNKPALRYHWIGMNVEHPKLQDINVRKAIRYAIDVPSILQAAYDGQAEQQFCLIAPGLLGHWEDAPRIERDVEKAKEFMAAAGLETLELRLDLEDVAQDRIWAEITQENLKEIGINVTLNPMDSSTYWTASFGEQSVNNELFTSGYSMQPDPAWATMWFTCEQVNVWNAMRWCNPTFDELHYEALVEMDDEKRAELYIEMQQLWEDAAHTVWLTHGVRPYAYLSSVRPALTPHGKPQPQWFSAA